MAGSGSFPGMVPRRDDTRSAPSSGSGQRHGRHDSGTRMRPSAQPGQPCRAALVRGPGAARSTRRRMRAPDRTAQTIAAQQNVLPASLRRVIYSRYDWLTRLNHRRRLLRDRPRWSIARNPPILRDKTRLENRDHEENIFLLPMNSESRFIDVGRAGHQFWWPVWMSDRAASAPPDGSDSPSRPTARHLARHLE